MEKLDRNLKIFIVMSAAVFLAIAVLTARYTREIDDTLLEIGSLVDLPGGNTETKPGLKKFASAEEFEKKLNELEKIQQDKQVWYESAPTTGFSLPSTSMSAPTNFSNALSAGGGESQDFSKTNVQVEGIDEADIVKTDGNYIYTTTKNFITISKAVPVDEAKITSKIELKNATPQEIFIDGDNLMVFGRRSYPYEEVIPSKEKTSPVPLFSEVLPDDVYPSPRYTNVAFVQIYNISDREKPELKRNTEFDGSYLTSRKIGTDVYFVLNNSPRFYYMQDSEKKTRNRCESDVPSYREGTDFKYDSPMNPLVRCVDINYIEPIQSAQYASVIGISMDDYSKDISKKVIMGAGENVYASESSIYLAKTDYNYDYSSKDKPVSSGIIAKRKDSQETTGLFKFKIEKSDIDFENSGKVPGRILNQFSMDEFDGHFRIATTIGHVSRDNEASSSNNIYILDSNLDRTGSIEDIAPGEQIYSVRFMGKRGFLVTFKKVDPFFTLDLSDPKDPKLAGKLKIPGYSDYLHPYDENHIIGIGKNTIESSESLKGTANFAWYQGLKMAMFNVTDIENPEEMFKIEIGDRGTDSPILTDHKAFLFSKEKNLLVIPVLEAKLTEAQKKDNQEGNAYGEFSYQGAYIFNINMEKGFDLRGRITHFTDSSAFKKSGYYFGNNDLSIRRSLYIGDTLYTVSNQKIFANKLDNLEKIKEVDFDLPKIENTY